MAKTEDKKKTETIESKITDTQIKIYMGDIVPPPPPQYPDRDDGGRGGNGKIFVCAMCDSETWGKDVSEKMVRAMYPELMRFNPEGKPMWICTSCSPREQAIVLRGDRSVINARDKK